MTGMTTAYKKVVPCVRTYLSYICHASLPLSTLMHFEPLVFCLLYLNAADKVWNSVTVLGMMNKYLRL